MAYSIITSARKRPDTGPHSGPARFRMPIVEVCPESATNCIHDRDPSPSKHPSPKKADGIPPSQVPPNPWHDAVYSRISSLTLQVYLSLSVELLDIAIVKCEVVYESALREAATKHLPRSRIHVYIDIRTSSLRCHVHVGCFKGHNPCQARVSRQPFRAACVSQKHCA